MQQDPWSWIHGVSKCNAAKAESPQHCIMDFVSEMHGGPKNIPITAKDIANL